eukprot:CAMPEP_0177287498 /NCGR_PEP_ID=MMETSP0367-20130122/74184_1 /TAXON_ID=447022 ORGANISM="Scrippsiella hangoei-like, Strain SHHI-4" /NCGR_SAMPLE_ID=MMETSP0367 /ASSEMBLY_ACC=CAM_ASM_000362 /LENGTH=190 /DNA_ID=CAMNT_0018744807 /DNA_START=387 /DNA_END=959 /DNA_ORIENTATION=+
MRHAVLTSSCRDLLARSCALPHWGRTRTLTSCNGDAEKVVDVRCPLLRGQHWRRLPTARFASFRRVPGEERSGLKPLLTDRSNFDTSCPRLCRLPAKSTKSITPIRAILRELGGQGTGPELATGAAQTQAAGCPRRRSPALLHVRSYESAPHWLTLTLIATSRSESSDEVLDPDMAIAEFEKAAGGDRNC